MAAVFLCGLNVAHCRVNMSTFGMQCTECKAHAISAKGFQFTNLDFGTFSEEI